VQALRLMLIEIVKTRPMISMWMRIMTVMAMATMRKSQRNEIQKPRDHSVQAA
jgi:hypothetical protein